MSPMMSLNEFHSGIIDKVHKNEICLYLYSNLGKINLEGKFFSGVHVRVM